MRHNSLIELNNTNDSLEKLSDNLESKTHVSSVSSLPRMSRRQSLREPESPRQNFVDLRDIPRFSPREPLYDKSDSCSELSAKLTNTDPLLVTTTLPTCEQLAQVCIHT